MKKLIEKYQSPSSTLDWWNQNKHKQVIGKTLHRFIGIDGENKGQTGWVEPTDSVVSEGVRGYAYYDNEGNPTGRYTSIEGDPRNASIY